MKTAEQDAFSRPNPHALAVIMEASQTKNIIASRDIFDISGTKLWARHQPVSDALQRKLLDRQLLNPMEACLMAEDGVTPATLLQATQELLADDSPLSVLIRPHAARIEREVAHLPLHSVAQLLLTVGKETRPECFRHAIQAMALCGALMAARGAETPHCRAAMVAGLLHDIGEMYISPQYMCSEDGATLDFQGYKHLVVHPHIGALLLSQLTNYPPQITRAIGEHHERLDGSGYPRGLQQDAISSYGRLLAAVEASVGILQRSGSKACMARVSIALRVVPGEFDLQWVGSLAEVAGQRFVSTALAQPIEVLRERIASLNRALQCMGEQVRAQRPSAQGAQALNEAFELAQHLLGRLTVGWHASGLWGLSAISQGVAEEVEAVEGELNYRLAGIERAVRLRAGALSPEEMAQVDALCNCLRAVPLQPL